MNVIKKLYNKARSNYTKKSGSTYFYWADSKNKPSGKLKKTRDLNKAGEVLVCPRIDQSFPLNLADCIYFAVDYDWYDREIWISYFYPVFEEYKDKQAAYMEKLSDIKVHQRTSVFHIMECDVSTSLITGENMDETPAAFGNNLPEPVMKFVLKEIRRMQTGCYGSKPKKFIPQKISKKSVMDFPLFQLNLRYYKKVYDFELLSACVYFPYSPVVNYYGYSDNKQLNTALDCIYSQLNWCKKNILKEFFGRFGITDYKQLLSISRRSSDCLSDYLFLKECNFKNRHIINYFLRNNLMLSEYQSPEGKEFLKKCIENRGERFTKKTLIEFDRIYTSTPDCLWDYLTQKVLDRKGHFEI